MVYYIFRSVLTPLYIILELIKEYNQKEKTLTQLYKQDRAMNKKVLSPRWAFKSKQIPYL